MSRSKGSDGRGRGGIKNGDSINKGGGEIKKKDEKTFAEQVKKKTPKTKGSWVDKTGGKKAESKSFAEQIRPTEKAQPKAPVTLPKKRPSVPSTGPKVQVNRKAPAKGIASVKAAAPKVAPKKATPVKVKKAPVKRR